MATNWIRPLLCVAAVAGSFGSLAGCEGPKGDDGPAGPPGPSGSSAVSPAHQALAGRIAEAQLLNGSWAFTGTWYEPIDYTYTGLQNVTGATGFGLFDAYQADLADDGVAQEMWFVPAPWRERRTTSSNGWRTT
jgi:hypothetical protein